MTEDWPAVARAINARLTELGLNQQELVARSQLSRATVSEIQHDTARRRRSARTLETLSTALDWHPGHLAAVLAGRRAPKLAEPVVRSDADVPGRLAAIEHRLGEIADKLDDLTAANNEMQITVSAAVNKLAGDRKKLGR